MHCSALHKESLGDYKGLYVLDGSSRAGSEQEYVTAGIKREIKSGHKDTRGAVGGKTCCFSNRTTTTESHFIVIFCPACSSWVLNEPVDTAVSAFFMRLLQHKESSVV